MNRRLLLLGCLLICILCFLGNNAKEVSANSYSGTITVTTDTSDVMVGQTVTFTVTISSNDPMGIANGEFFLNYDIAKLKFVSSNGTTGTGFSGSIPMQVDPGIDESTVYTVTFEAIGTGTSEITVPQDSITFVGYSDLTAISMVVRNASLNVWAAGSDDASLNALSIAGYSLSPAFAPGITSYTCYVGSEITSASISATTTQGGRIEMSAANPVALNYGNNSVNITAYAPNGGSMTYTITIVRPEPATEAPTTEPATEAPTEAPTTVPADVTITVGSEEYTIGSDFASEDVPLDYAVSTVNYQGNDVLAVTNDKLGLTLFWLKNSDGTGGFFIYNEAKGTFYPYHILNIADATYTMMNPEDSEFVPSLATLGVVKEFGEGIEVYVSDTDSDFIYFYGMNASGDLNWYSYDAKEQTVQRMNTGDSVSTGDGTKIKELQDQVESLTADQESLKEKNQTLKNSNRVALAVSVGLGVLLLSCVLVFMVVMTRRKQDQEEQSDEDYLMNVAMALETVEETEELESLDPLAQAQLNAEWEAELRAELELEEEAAMEVSEDVSEDIVDDISETEDQMDQEEELPDLTEETISAPIEEEVLETVQAPEESDSNQSEEPTEPEEVIIPEEILTEDDITKEEMDSFQREAMSLSEMLAAEVSGVLSEEEQDFEPQIINLDEEEEEPEKLPLTPSELDRQEEEIPQVSEQKTEEDEEFFL